MSPSESQLRAALRDGEGESIDVGAVIAHANGVRASRRRRVNAFVGGTVAAALLGLGSLAILDNGSGTGGSAGSNADGSAFSASGGGNGSAAERRVAPTTAPVVAGGAAGVAAPCPPSPTAVAVPTGMGGGALLPSRVASITACGYRPARGVRSALITGAGLQRVATALNRRPPHPNTSVPCPRPAGPTRTIELLPVDDQNRRIAPVLIRIHCVASATNGTAVRYAVVLPPRLLALVR